MAIPFYYNPATNELELTADPSPLRDSLGTRFGLNEISIARNTLSPTKSYTEEGRIGFSRGTEVEFAKLPGVQTRSIELLNKGLTTTEVAQTLEAEGLVKFNIYFSKSQGKNVTSYTSMSPYFKRLLAEGELDIEEIGTKSQETLKRNVKLLKVIKNNLDLNAEQISKKAALDLGYEISPTAVNNLAKKEGINLISRHARIFPEIEYLDQLIKKNKKYLSTSIKEISSYQKEKFLFQEWSKGMKKKFGRNYKPDDFINRIQRLGEIYAQGPGRYEVELYKKIKAPLNYKNSMLHKNLMGIATKSFLGVVAKAKMLDLPKNQIQLLEDVLKGAKELSNGKMSIAGDHTDIDALMKNFADYKKNFTRINIISYKLNNIKLAADHKLINLVKKFNAGLIQPDEFKQKVQAIRTEFTNKTKVPISNPQIKGGKIVLDFQTPRLIDLKHPRWTTMNQAVSNLVEQSGLKVTSFDNKLSKITTVKERFNLLKNAGLEQLNKSKILRGFAKMKGPVGNAAKLLLAGTITSAALTTLASAAETETLEPGDEKQEDRTAVFPYDIVSAIAKDPETAAVLGGATALGTFGPKKIIGGVLKAAEKAISPILPPLTSVVARGPHKPDVTSGLEWLTPTFWNAIVKKFGLTGTIEAFKKATTVAAKEKIAIELLLRAGIPVSALPAISGGAAVISAPLLYADAAKALQKRIDKKGLTGLIAKGYPDPMSAGADVFMEDVIKEKKRRDAEGMDYAQGGIASLMK